MTSLHTYVASYVDAETNRRKENCIWQWWRNARLDDPFQKRLFWKKLSINPTLLTFAFVRKNRNRPWSWYSLSRNKGVVTSWNIVQDNMHLPWNFRGLSIQPWLTWDIVVNHLDKPWDFKLLSGRNDIITWEIVEAHPHLPWNWLVLSYVNDSVTRTWEHIDAHPDAPWDWYGLSLHPGLATPENILQRLDKPWHWPVLSDNPTITTDFIRATLDKPWDWTNLSASTCIDMDFVAENKDKPWCWIILSDNPRLTYEFVSQNRDIPWISYFVSRNVSLTIEIIRKDKHFPWDWRTLSENKSFTYEMIMDNSDLPWNMYGLCLNPNLSHDQLVQINARVYKIPRDYSRVMYFALANNPQLTFEDIIRNPDKPWCFEHLCRNAPFFHKELSRSRLYIPHDYDAIPCTHIPHAYDTCWTSLPWNIPELMDVVTLTMSEELINAIKVKYARIWFAKAHICRVIFEAFTNPRYTLCRKRLEKEYKELCEDFEIA